jgi:hypothetical protein
MVLRFNYNRDGQCVVSFVCIIVMMGRDVVINSDEFLFLWFVLCSCVPVIDLKIDARLRFRSPR